MKNLCTLLIFICSSVVFAQEDNCDKGYIDVTGTAEMEVVPDEIYLRIILSESDDKDKKSLSRLEKDLLSKMEYLGISLSNLSVDDAASFFQKRFLTGKEIYSQKTYELLIENASAMGKVMEELESVGISNIGLKSVDNSKIEEYKKQVKIDATKAAKEKARYMLEAVGDEVGQTLFIKEIDTYYGAPMYANSELEMDGGREDKFEINFKKIVLKYSVSARFKIK